MTLLSRIFLCFALVGLLTLAAPPSWTEVQAQKAAKNVKCNGCVGSKDVQNGGIKKKDLNKKLRNKIDDNMMGANRRSFSARINANETRDLLVFGTFVLFAQCIINQGGFDRLQVGLRSTRNNWLHPFFPTLLLPLTQLVILEFIQAATGSRVYNTFERPGGLGPTGSLLGLIYLAMGLNVLGNACLVHGWADTGQLE